MQANWDNGTTGQTAEPCCRGFRSGNRMSADRKKNSEYVANIIFNLIFLWIVHNITDWGLSFIRDNWNVVVWVLDISIFAQIGGNALMLAFDSRPLRRICRIAMESASFVASLTLYYIYPFDFSNTSGMAWFDRVLPILLIIGMVVSGVKVFGNLWKLIFGSR